MVFLLGVARRLPMVWMAFGISVLFLGGVFWLMLLGKQNRDDLSEEI